MKISILCSDPQHPVYPFLEGWKKTHCEVNEVELVNEKRELSGGEILFLVSCNEIINDQIRRLYRKTLVLHASDLPSGRGWSPHVWQILEGKNEIIISLLEADDRIDSGDIWFKEKIKIENHELSDEINKKIFKLELELMDYALKNYYEVKPVKQDDENVSYYPKRQPSDSRVDPYKTFAEQFDLLRVSDPKRYPAFIEYRGYRYNLTIEKASKIFDEEKN